MWLPEFNYALDTTSIGHAEDLPLMEQLEVLTNCLMDNPDVGTALGVASIMAEFCRKELPGLHDALDDLRYSADVLLNFAINYSEESKLTAYVLMLIPVLNELGVEYSASLHALLMRTKSDSFVARLYKFFMIPTDDFEVLEEIITSLLHVRMSPSVMNSLVYSFSHLIYEIDLIALAKWQDVSLDAVEEYVNATRFADKVQWWQRLARCYNSRVEMVTDVDVRVMHSF